jgi:hypothetical protein
MSLACVAPRPAIATVIFQDDFLGTAIDTNNWVADATVNVSSSVAHLNSTTGRAAIYSTTTWSAADALYYNFKVGANFTEVAGGGNFFGLESGLYDASNPQILLRSESGNLLFRVDDNAGNVYAPLTAVSLLAGDTVSFGWSSAGVNLYKNGTLIDSTTVSPAGPMLVQAYSFGGAIQNYDVFSITDTAPIPEPNSLVLVATGLIGLLAYAWRKR